jgi:hypothetical protein
MRIRPTVLWHSRLTPCREQARQQPTGLRHRLVRIVGIEARESRDPARQAAPRNFDHLTERTARQAHPCQMRQLAVDRRSFGPNIALGWCRRLGAAAARLQRRGPEQQSSFGRYCGTLSLVYPAGKRGVRLFFSKAPYAKPTLTPLLEKTIKYSFVRGL